jgi:hypothetical protein
LPRTCIVRFEHLPLLLLPYDDIGLALLNQIDDQQLYRRDAGIDGSMPLRRQMAHQSIPATTTAASVKPNKTCTTPDIDMQRSPAGKLVPPTRNWRQKHPSTATPTGSRGMPVKPFSDTALREALHAALRAR